MRNRWRIVATTAAVVIGTAGAASAQTVYLRNAPAGSSVEVLVDAASSGKGTVDASGEAKVAFTLPTDKTEMDANVFVDTCGTLRKVVIVNRVRQPPPPAEGCERREIPGIYWVRPVNTVVVDVGGPTPTLLLVRGDYTPPKPVAEGEEEHPTRPLPSGLIMFAGGDYTNFRDVGIFACGNASPCTAKTSGIAYAFGATVWLTRFVGVEGTYMRPHQAKASGGDTYTFKTTLDSDVWTVMGKLGAQAGVVRLYGQGGMNYHEATNKTSETIDSLSQNFEYKTTGWSWVFGGGMEAWVGARQRMAIYADGGIMRLSGKSESGGEAKIDDRLKYVDRRREAAFEQVGAGPGPGYCVTVVTPTSSISKTSVEYAGIEKLRTSP